MNERIKQLAEQAGLQCSKDEALCFAELIARECAELCDRLQARNVGMQPAEAAGAIRLMFGVKE